MMRIWILLCLPLTLWAEDWPQWLGPQRNGSSSQKIAPWKGDLPVAWKVAVGEGNSSPVVAGDILILHVKGPNTQHGASTETVLALNVKDGKEKWSQTYEKPKFDPLFGKGPRATPVIHDKKVYTLGNTGVLSCFELETGKEIFRVETLDDPVKDNLVFGVSASPLIVGPHVIVQGGSKTGKGIKAFDKSTGKLVWTSEKNDPASYAAPVLLGKEIVTLTGGHLVSLDETGKTLWKHPFKDALNESSTTPIKVGDLYIAASVTAGAVAVKKVESSEKKGVFKAEPVWTNKTLTCYFSTPVPVGEKHLFMVTGSADFLNASVNLRCVETATGKEVWNKPKIGKFHTALLTLGDGNILAHFDNGELALLAPDVKEYKELARSKACGSTWAHPAIAAGHIFVRDDKYLYALKIPE